MALSVSFKTLTSGVYPTFDNVLYTTGGGKFGPICALAKLDETIFDLTTLMPSSGGSVAIAGTLPAFAATPTFNFGTIGTAASAANQTSQITQETAIAAVLGTIADAAWSGSGNATIDSILKKIALTGLGAITVADGADVTLGSQADGAWVSGAGSLIAVAKAIVNAVKALPLSLPVAPVRSTALESSHPFKSGAGICIDTHCDATTVSGWYMLFDAVSAPADGAVTPLDYIQVGAGQTSSFDYSSNYPLLFSTGLVGVFSSTGPFTKTTSTTAAMSARVI